MAKIKPLLPTLREKKRYVSYEILSDKPIKNIKGFGSKITESYLSLFGEIGLADAGIIHLEDKFDEDNMKGIIRISHKCVGRLKSAFMFIRNFYGEDIIVRSQRVSGILKKVKG